MGGYVPETSFEVIFDGPGLEDGRMPVRDLAPSLMALGNLFSVASAVIHPKQPPAALKIRGTEQGSFVIDLILEAPNTWDQFVRIFDSESANAIVNFRDLVIGIGGVFWFIQHGKGKKIEARENTVDAQHVKVTFDDGTTVEVPADVLALYDNLRIRKTALESVEPVGREGVDRVRFRRNKQVTVEVQPEDLPAYDLPETDELPALEEETNMILSIASVAFVEGNKWRFSDGQKTFSAAIDDLSFFDRVMAGSESFRSGDMLICRMRVSQKRRGEDLQTDYSVVRVERHIPREVQLGLEVPERPDAPPALSAG